MFIYELCKFKSTFYLWENAVMRCRLKSAEKKLIFINLIEQEAGNYICLTES